MGDELLHQALRLLAAKDYTEAGLRRKLARRGSPEEVEAAVRRVKELGYLDDRRYAESYLRLNQGRWGMNKLRQALRSRGVSVEVIRGVLADLESEADPVAEALRLLERYPSRYKGEKAKAIRFLLNRGFPLSAALAAWERYSQTPNPER
ncbi:MULTISPECIES: regulatory protein RecX [unclassified Meiothermus]|uniref:regulatory protein RecX n=1 Tax=unclassified Meiothermus TaxID=370471 RepID=UPI000D7D1CA3|nr:MULTISPECIES: regulatory protein RecX [unclassified Meiothermus]PZA08386.1 recombination regulator RecX [Meiothermus sp. Pnk-1]RYM37054.1 regulatory protein RecX [Meiothermus sp. PNK-Is4]